MGTSTDAIVAFGFNLGEEIPDGLKINDGDDENLDFDDWIAEHMGLGDNWEEEGYFDKKRAAVSAFPVDIILHCSYDYPEYFLSIRGTEVRARRGYPENLDLQTIEQGKISELREFCDKHGIEWEEPSWHLFSMWG